MQAEFLDEFELPMQACRSFGIAEKNKTSATAVDYYEDNFLSVNNIMCQLNSLATVTAMWRRSGRRYDAVIYLRPDVLFNCALKAKWVDAVQPGTVYIPDFHQWNGYNDRFAMGTPETIALWGDRCAPTHLLPLRLPTHDHTSACMSQLTWTASDVGEGDAGTWDDACQKSTWPTTHAEHATAHQTHCSADPHRRLFFAPDATQR